VIESTINAKTRGIAIRELRFCVESRGLNGIGKKGLQVQAKSFSEENLLENKGFHLDLIQLIILKMNGDINKYFKICGSTALSRKSKDLIEERMAKVQKTSLENDNSKFSQESNKTRPVNRIEQPLASHHVSVEDKEESSASEKTSEVADGPFKFSFGAIEADSPPKSASPLSATG
jgi:hypothetical protein